MATETNNNNMMIDAKVDDEGQTQVTRPQVDKHVLKVRK